MQYEKKIKDVFGDDSTVSVGMEATDEFVLVQFPEDAGDEMVYSPEQARRLARALKRAANVAEGKPAKAKKPKTSSDPEVYEDRDGDLWYRGPNGLYKCGVEFPDFTWTFAELERTYGV